MTELAVGATRLQPDGLGVYVLLNNWVDSDGDLFWECLVVQAKNLDWVDRLFNHDEKPGCTTHLAERWLKTNTVEA